MLRDRTGRQRLQHGNLFSNGYFWQTVGLMRFSKTYPKHPAPSYKTVSGTTPLVRAARWPHSFATDAVGGGEIYFVEVLVGRSRNVRISEAISSGFSYSAKWPAFST